MTVNQKKGRRWREEKKREISSLFLHRKRKSGSNETDRERKEQRKHYFREEKKEGKERHSPIQFCLREGEEERKGGEKACLVIQHQGERKKTNKS